LLLSITLCGFAPHFGICGLDSARCADVDFYHWLNGKYAIPASEEAEPGAEEASEDE
jgi:endogenous inhibitor of DNA gyrase (YacG/DUF329 family)